VRLPTTSTAPSVTSVGGPSTQRIDASTVHQMTASVTTAVAQKGLRREGSRKDSTQMSGD
jgi:hypothetical protein